MPRKKLKRSSIARYNHNNSRRLPRWRFDRVRYLLDDNEQGGKSRPHTAEDDEYITLAFTFFKNWERIDQYDLDPVSLERRRQLEIFDDNPGLYYAYELYQAPKDDLTRHHIDAHILAQRSDEDIAARTDQIPATIEWYEKMFFNVRPRIRNKTYIDSMVLAKAVNCGLHQLNFILVNKLWAYYGGPHLLDAVLHGLPASFVKPGPRADMRRIIVDAQNLEFVKKSADATKALGAGDINTFNFFELVNAQQQIVAAVEAAQKEVGQHTPLEETVQAVLGGLQWVVGASRRQALAQSPLGPYMGHSAEPRADDQLRIASGLPVDYTPEELSQRRLPPLVPKEGKKDAATIKQEG